MRLGGELCSRCCRSCLANEGRQTAREPPVGLIAADAAELMLCVSRRSFDVLRSSALRWMSASTERQLALPTQSSLSTAPVRSPGSGQSRFRPAMRAFGPERTSIVVILAPRTASRTPSRKPSTCRLLLVSCERSGEASFRAGRARRRGCCRRGGICASCERTTKLAEVRSASG